MGRPVSDRTCGLAGCGRKHKADDMCNMHYLRFRRQGEPGQVAPLIRLGEFGPNWRGGKVAYKSAHEAVRRHRGRAAEHDCDGCQKRAKHWAYDHLDPDERRDGERVYSNNPSHYLPMCVSCHHRFDRSHARAVA